MADNLFPNFTVVLYYVICCNSASKRKSQTSLSLDDKWDEEQILEEKHDLLPVTGSIDTKKVAVDAAVIKGNKKRKVADAVSSSDITVGGVDSDQGVKKCEADTVSSSVDTAHADDNADTKCMVDTVTSSDLPVDGGNTDDEKGFVSSCGGGMKSEPDTVYASDGGTAIINSTDKVAVGPTTTRRKVDLVVDSSEKKYAVSLVGDDGSTTIADQKATDMDMKEESSSKPPVIGKVASGPVVRRRNKKFEADTVTPASSNQLESDLKKDYPDTSQLQKITPVIAAAGRRCKTGKVNATVAEKTETKKRAAGEIEAQSKTNASSDRRRTVAYQKEKNDKAEVECKKIKVDTTADKVTGSRRCRADTATGKASVADSKKAKEMSSAPIAATTPKRVGRPRKYEEKAKSPPPVEPKRRTALATESEKVHEVIF